MTYPICTAECVLPPISVKEVLRYAGEKAPSEEVLLLLQECMAECDGIFGTKVTYRIFPIERIDGKTKIGSMEIDSDGLKKNLINCDFVILFAATVGIGIDRLIGKYANLSPAKALLFHSIGTERVEALCDAFCEKFSTEKNVSLAPRFSPGYGDFSLEAQREILLLLNAGSTMGIGLSESLLLSPSKSVTALAGIHFKKECESYEF